MATFPILPQKTGMLFFDTLNLYLHPEVKLEDWIAHDLPGYPDSARRAAIEQSGVIQRMQTINKVCREAGIAIFYGQADHRPDYKDFSPHIVDGFADGPRRTVPPAVVSGSIGAEVIPELAPQPGDYVIKKHRWSTFYQTHFELSLRTAGIDTLIMAGGAVEIGIASTAYAARDLDFSLIVLRDVCTGRPEVLDFFMGRVFPGLARVMTLEQVVAEIRQARSSAVPPYHGAS